MIVSHASRARLMMCFFGWSSLSALSGDETLLNTRRKSSSAQGGRRFGPSSRVVPVLWCGGMVIVDGRAVEGSEGLKYVTERRGCALVGSGKQVMVSAAAGSSRARTDKILMLSYTNMDKQSLCDAANHARGSHESTWMNALPGHCCQGRPSGVGVRPHALYLPSPQTQQHHSVPRPM